MSFFLIMLLFLNHTKIDAARILAVFPIPCISHQMDFRPLTQELVKRGHEVIVITTDPVFSTGQVPTNLTEIDVHDLSYSAWKTFVEMSDGLTTRWQEKIENGLKLQADIFEKQMKTKEVREKLFAKNARFDLLLAEAYVRSVLCLSNVFKVPTIQISSLGFPLSSSEFIGAPSHPFLYSTVIRDRKYNLTIWETTVQLLKEIQFNFLLQCSEAYENIKMKQIFGPETPSLNVLYNNVEMLFVNIHPIWEDNRPVPPNVVFMGGIHQNKYKPLQKDLQFFLDSSRNGVIYISFGTNVLTSLLSPVKVEMMINVFSRLPYEILWKWDQDELPSQSKNIKISKWLPQADLLRHPKIKLFITQGGLQSTDEAITAGVPLIGIPMLGDQWFNVEKYVRHKIGLRIDFDTLSEQTFETAIKTVIQDKSYRENIAHLRDLMMDQPQQPLDRAVWWVEYILRHGGAQHLRRPMANMSWADYCEWRLVCLFAMLVSVTLIALFAVVLSIKKFSRSKILKNIKAKIA